MKVIVVDIQNCGWLNPEKPVWDLALTRYLRCPREEEGVDQARYGAALISAGRYGLSELLGAVVSDLGQEVLHVVSCFEPIIVAVGKGSKPQTLDGPGCFGREAALREHTGGKGDFHAHPNETLGELKCRVNMTLCWKSQDEGVTLNHTGGAWD